MRIAVVVLCVLCVPTPRVVRAQSITAEAAVTGGLSTDEVSAAAVQLRAFGDVTHEIRFFGEAAWAGRSLSDRR